MAGCFVRPGAASRLPISRPWLRTNRLGPSLDLMSDATKLAALSQEGRGRVVRVQEILSQAVDCVGRFGLRELIERTWLALGGPAVLPLPNQREDVSTFLDLLASLERGGVIRDFSLLNEKLEFILRSPFHE